MENMNRKYILILSMLSIFMIYIGCQNNSTNYEQKKDLLSINEKNSDNDPLATIAYQISRYVSSESGGKKLIEAIMHSKNKRKSINLRLFYDQIKKNEKIGPIKIDTSLVEKSLLDLPKKIEIYPYWRQLSMWNLELNPNHVAIVYWDARKGDGESVSGYILPELKPIILKDHEKLDFPVIVISVPENCFGKEETKLNTTKNLDSGGGGSVTNWEVHFVHVYNDHEPDWAEPPEFYIKAKASNGEWRRTDISPPVVNTSPWWFTKTIYEFGTYRPNWSLLEIWEDDFGAPDDLVEKYWYFSGSCSKWVDTATMYEKQLIGCYGERGADITVQVVNPY